MSHTLLDTAIAQANGRFVTITFRKNDGSLRRINGRFGVHFRGEAAETYEAASTGRWYYRIWSAKDRGFRLVNAHQIVNIASQGVSIFNRQYVQQPHQTQRIAA